MNKQVTNAVNNHIANNVAGSTGQRGSLWTGLLYALGAGIAIVLPLILVQAHMPFVRLMDEVYHPTVLLQLYVFSASAVLLLVLAGTLWQRREQWLEALPVVLGVLVAFHVLALMRQHDGRSWDYLCYEEAAKAIINGANPYGHCYIYFPTPAQAMASAAQVIDWAVAGKTLAFVGAANQSDAQAALWDILFYFYEATQLILVIGAFALCYRLARVLELQRLYAGGLVAALFLFNNPLLATLKHNQVNLWVLDLVLLAMLGIQRYPMLSGIFVAIGAHIKLYPLALLLPWTLKRQWRGLFSAGIGMVVIVLLQTNGGRELALWQQFLAFADSFPQGTFFRDNSLHSLVYNTLGHLQWLLGNGTYVVNERYISHLVLMAMGFLGLLYLWRFMQREQMAATSATATVKWSWRSAPSRLLQSPLTDRTVLLGHTMDALAFALIASPVVWEHHYLLAMPIVIWGFSQARKERQQWLIAISAFLIFVLPTFDIFPFSYHRLGGLVLLMVTLSPLLLAQSSALDERSDTPVAQPAVSMTTAHGLSTRQ